MSTPHGISIHQAIIMYLGKKNNDCLSPSCLHGGENLQKPGVEGLHILRSQLTV
jgi:hypothetical protein